MSSFGKDYWEKHWGHVGAAAEHEDHGAPTNPHVMVETRDLVPGNALDAGCGTGTEAIWLAARGWHVTGADISNNALSVASERARAASVSERVTWVEADLTSWEPAEEFDLVITNYAHAALPQLAFYRRIANWVVPGGTLIIVAHLRRPTGTEVGPQPPGAATASLEEITSILGPVNWSIDSAREHVRALNTPAGSPALLRDVVVRATRRLYEPPRF